MGCCIVSSGRVISVGCNQIKTHPDAWHTGLHCEMVAIRNSAHDFNLKGSSIFVYRESRKTGLPAMARPCKYCMAELKKEGFKWIYYSTNEYPYWESEKIK